MSRHILIAAGLMAMSAALHAQTEKNIAFQFFGEGQPAGIAGVKMIGIEGIGGKTVTGKPVSLTEERQTVQVLGDGTRIQNKQTDKFYRDMEGRTRVERDNGAIIIQDPVAGVAVEISAEGKAVRRMNFRTTTPGSGAGATAAQIGGPADSARAKALERVKEKMDAELAMRSGTFAGTSGAATGGAFAYAIKSDALLPEEANREDLGIQSINGVTAQGTRITTTIAIGKIGNDRPIQVVSEQWFSTDLQMLVKSTNSDPRFGETTYQITNINQAAPDPTLFQVPADYNLR